VTILHYNPFLERGHIVRKQAAIMLRSMQALVRVSVRKFDPNKKNRTLPIPSNFVKFNKFWQNSTEF
jgi:hypothetical protein